MYVGQAMQIDTRLLGGFSNATLLHIAKMPFSLLVFRPLLFKLDLSGFENGTLSKHGTKGEDLQKQLTTFPHKEK